MIIVNVWSKSCNKKKCSKSDKVKKWNTSHQKLWPHFVMWASSIISKHMGLLKKEKAWHIQGWLPFSEKLKFGHEIQCFESESVILTQIWLFVVNENAVTHV